MLGTDKNNEVVKTEIMHAWSFESTFLWISTILIHCVTVCCQHSSVQMQTILKCFNDVFFSAKRFMNIQKFSHQFLWSHVEKDSFRILAVLPAFHNSQQKLGGIVLEIQNQVHANLESISWINDPCICFNWNYQDHFFSGYDSELLAPFILLAYLIGLFSHFNVSML